MDIPPPGMIRNPGAHFEQKIGSTAWGVGSLSALYQHPKLKNLVAEMVIISGINVTQHCKLYRQCRM